MKDILKIVIPALLALAGTLMVALLGYRQWKRQQMVSRYGSFFVDRQTAYKTMWEKIEDVHVKLRADEISREEFNKLLQEVNFYILKNSLYLDENIKRLVNLYLERVYTFSEAVKLSENEEAKFDWAISRAMEFRSEEFAVDLPKVWPDDFILEEREKQTLEDEKDGEISLTPLPSPLNIENRGMETIGDVKKLVSIQESIETLRTELKVLCLQGMGKDIT